MEDAVGVGVVQGPEQVHSHHAGLEQRQGSAQDVQKTHQVTCQWEDGGGQVQ